jgi:hypothetical protein
MTTPIELLIERMNEIATMIRIGSIKKLDKESLDKLKNLYNQYYSMIYLAESYIEDNRRLIKEARQSDFSPLIFTDELMKTSKYKGVTFNIRNNKYQVYYHKDRKKIHLGYFKSEKEAYIKVREHKKQTI